MTDEPALVIYTDGGCIGNPGPGGWGAVIVEDGRQTTLSGSFRETTNNRMELRAAIEALNALDRPRRVAIYTDSTYVRDGITSWVHGWQRNGWRTAAKQPVKNQDLWQALLAAMARHAPAGGVAWHWVRGHGRDRLNQLADRLANDAARGVTASDPLDVAIAV